MTTTSLRSFSSLLAGATLAVLAISANAQSNNDHSQHANHGATSSAPAETSTANATLTNGEVTRWNAATGKVTIRHEEIKNLSMPPMTMVFTLKNPAQGEALKAGDKVRFHAEEVNGALVITHLERAAE